MGWDGTGVGAQLSFERYHTYIDVSFSLDNINTMCSSSTAVCFAEPSHVVTSSVTECLPRPPLAHRAWTRRSENLGGWGSGCSN